MSAQINPLRRAGVSRSRMLASLLAAAGVAWLWAASVEPAQADFGIAAFDGQVSANPAGDAFTQAGGHPFDASTTFHINTDGNGDPDGELLRDVVIDLPVGFVGNPTVAPTCRPADFVREALIHTPQCPRTSQIGIAEPETSGNASIAGALYNLEPPPGVAAEFGFQILSVPVFLEARVRPGDYGLQIVVKNIPHTVVLPTGSWVTIWGVPADPAHDVQRCDVLLPQQGCTTPGATDAPLQPFLTLPTTCTPDGIGLESKLGITGWGGASDSASFISHNPPGYTLPAPFTPPGPLDRLPPEQWGSPQGPTGCELLPFDPSMSVHPDSTEPDAPTGLSVKFSFPQEGLDNPLGIATAHLKRARVVLPEGMTISPSAASGLKGCSDTQLGLGSDAAVQCPDASKIGTVVAKTPLLAEQLEGSVYVGTQQSDDPGSGKMFRIFLVLENKERGLLVKLAGEVRLNSQTGRVETVFDNNPQVPVSSIDLELKTGPRAPLATPSTCGRKEVTAELTAWNGAVRNLTDTFTIDCTPDLGGFSPAFDAGTVTPSAGAFSPFVVRISRPDRQQYLAGLSIEMPGGMFAKLKGVTLCQDAQANAGTCPQESRVGSAITSAGPGSNPYFLPGSVSLTGPYNGAPFGLAVAVRAVAGPFDLGTVVVRQAIRVDPIDGHITVDSDQLPTIVKGVPIRLRTVAVDVDRPGFTLNPTSCAEKKIHSTFVSLGGARAEVHTRFQVGDCAALAFSPKLSLQLTGRGQTTDGKHPGVKAVLTQPRRQANIKRVAVKLPLSLALDPENASSDSLCEFDEGQKAEPKCPASSIIGRAKAITPLLNRPLTGNVYFVKNVRIDPRTGRRIRTLPTLLVALRGEVALNLRATSSISKGKLVNTFKTVPDAPVTRFELTLKGGPRGILTVTNDRNLCRGKQLADVAIGGQNGKRTDKHSALKTPCKHR